MIFTLSPWKKAATKWASSGMRGAAGCTSSNLTSYSSSSFCALFLRRRPAPASLSAGSQPSGLIPRGRR